MVVIVVVVLVMVVVVVIVVIVVVLVMVVVLHCLTLAYLYTQDNRTKIRGIILSLLVTHLTYHLL